MLPEIQQSIISPAESPYKKATDVTGFFIPQFITNVVTHLKSLYKSYHPLGLGKIPKTSHHNVILETIIFAQGQKTKMRYTGKYKIYLGAIPREDTLPSNSYRVSMLTAPEEQETSIRNTETTLNIPLLDHSVIDPFTGKNITLTKIQEEFDTLDESLKKFKQHHGKISPLNIYFHCMAGKSRSLTMLTIYLYYNDLLFNMDDFHPLPSEIAAFIKEQRPQAKSIDKMEGDQRGLLGLITLLKEDQRKSLPSILLAQNIRFILDYPLDIAFRDDLQDLEMQETAFISMYERFVHSNTNLFECMLIPMGKETEYDPLTTKPSTIKEQYNKNFEKLPPQAKMRFAILAKTVEDKKSSKTPLPVLPSKYNTAKHCAEAALQNIKQLSAGDLVEFLRTFGTQDPFTTTKGKICTTNKIYSITITKIIAGTSIDKHNAGIQLAELLSIYIKQKDIIDPLIYTKIASAFSQLSYQEQLKFVQRLTEIPNFSDRKIIQYFAGIAINNYNNRYFPKWNNPLSSSDLMFLANYEKPLLTSTTHNIYKRLLKPGDSAAVHSKDLSPTHTHDASDNPIDPSAPILGR